MREERKGLSCGLVETGSFRKWEREGGLVAESNMAEWRLDVRNRKDPGSLRSTDIPDKDEPNGFPAPPQSDGITFEAKVKRDFGKKEQQGQPDLKVCAEIRHNYAVVAELKIRKFLQE